MEQPLYKGTPFICLFAGLFFAYVFGMMAGTVTSTMDYLNMMMGGFASAGSWVIVMMMWVAAFWWYYEEYECL